MHEYKLIATNTKTEKALREIEQAEQEGWEVFSIQPSQSLIFGSGGSQGVWAILRKPKNRD